MSNNVVFEDNSLQVKAALDDIVLNWLEEAAGEIETSAIRNTKVGKVSGGYTKQCWSHTVDAGNGVAYVGNSQENAIWEEYGTGEYALEGKGRKGGWYIPIGEGRNEISQRVVDAYHFKVVKGKDGKLFAYTKGKKPKRTLYKAFNKKQNKLIKRLKEQLGELSNE